MDDQVIAPEITNAVVERVTVYRKFLRVTAREAVDRGSAAGVGTRQLWSVSVSTDDESADLDRYVRLMAAAAIDFVGKNTQRQRSVILTNRDGRVLLIERAAARVFSKRNA